MEPDLSPVKLTMVKGPEKSRSVPAPLAPSTGKKMFHLNIKDLTPDGEENRIWMKLAGPSKPVSRVLCPDKVRTATIYLDRTLPSGSCGQPGDGPGFPIVPLFGLAPDGVFLSRPVTRPLVSSYLAISPLP